MISAADVVAEAKSWVGVPYLHQGRTRFGVDCIGLVICVRESLGPWPEAWLETRNYGRRPKDDMLLNRIEAHCTRIDKPEDGALLVIRWPLTRCASHCAIWGGGNIIHAYEKVKRVIETGHRAHWARDTDSVWRLPGVAPP